MTPKRAVVFSSPTLIACSERTNFETNAQLTREQTDLAAFGEEDYHEDRAKNHVEDEQNQHRGQPFLILRNAPTIVSASAEKRDRPQWSGSQWQGGRNSRTAARFARCGAQDQPQTLQCRCERAPVEVRDGG